MNYSTLLAYPKPLTQQPETRVEPESQRVKLLWLSLKVMAIFATLYWLDFAANRLQPKRPVPVEQVPYDFHFVEDWYDSVGLTSTREEVDALLGPPTEPAVTSPELEALIPKIERSARTTFPSDRVWERWSDPKDPGKSVTILFARGIVYHKMKKGFESATR